MIQSDGMKELSDRYKKHLPKIFWVLFFGYILLTIKSPGGPISDEDMNKVIGCYENKRGVIELRKDEVIYRVNNNETSSRSIKYENNRYISVLSNPVIFYDEESEKLTIREMKGPMYMFVRGGTSKYIEIPSLKSFGNANEGDKRFNKAPCKAMKDRL